MTTLRKTHSAQLKAQVALEAIKGQRTVNEIASAFGLHPNLVGKWKKQVLAQLPQLFSDGPPVKSRPTLPGKPNSISRLVSEQWSSTG